MTVSSPTTHTAERNPSPMNSHQTTLPEPGHWADGRKVVGIDGMDDLIVGRSESPRQLIDRALAAYLRVLERTSRLLDPRTHSAMARPGIRVNAERYADANVPVQVVPHGQVDGEGGWYGRERNLPAPALTDGETIRIRAVDALRADHLASLMRLVPPTRDTVAQVELLPGFSPEAMIDPLLLQGLVWHEVSHVLWTPRKDYPLVRHITGEGLFPSFNALEDMRIESLFIQHYPDAVRALRYIALRYLAKATPTAYALTAGRPWIGDTVRQAQRHSMALWIVAQYPETIRELGAWAGTTSMDPAEVARETVLGLERLVREYVTLDPRDLRSGTRVEAEKILERSATARPVGRLNAKTKPILALIQRYDMLLDILNSTGDGPGTGHGEGGHADPNDATTRQSGGYRQVRDAPEPGQSKGGVDEDTEEQVDSWDLDESDPTEAPESDGEADGQDGQDGQDESEGDESEGDETGDETGEGNGNGEADGDADGEADGGGGEGESDGEAGDQDGDAHGAGSSSASAPKGGDDADARALANQAVRDAVDGAAREIRQEAAAEMADMHTAVRAMLNGREPLKAMDAPTLVPVPEEVLPLARRIGTELARLRNSVAPEIIRHTDRGRIDPAAYEVESQRPVPRWDQVWTDYRAGREDEISMEVMIALDSSSSMMGMMASANAATWAIKRAVESADPASHVTVWSFNSESTVLYPGNVPADSHRLNICHAEGGTNPQDALLEGYRLLRGSDAGIKLMVVVTDGEWMGGHNAAVVEGIKSLPRTGFLQVGIVDAWSVMRMVQNGARKSAPLMDSHDADWAIELLPHEIGSLPRAFANLVQALSRKVLTDTSGRGKLGTGSTRYLLPHLRERFDAGTLTDAKGKAIDRNWRPTY